MQPWDQRVQEEVQDLSSHTPVCRKRRGQRSRCHLHGRQSNQSSGRRGSLCLPLESWGRSWEWRIQEALLEEPRVRWICMKGSPQVPSICRNPCFHLAWPWRTMTMILALCGGWKRQQYILLTDLDTHVRKCSKHSFFYEICGRWERWPLFAIYLFCYHYLSIDLSIHLSIHPSFLSIIIYLSQLI